MTAMRTTEHKTRGAQTFRGRARSGLPRSRPAISLSYVILFVGVAIALVPFLYVVSTSFKESTSLFSYPPDWIPSPVFWGNFRSLFADHPFVQWTINTLFVSGAVTALKLWFDSMAGYALAKMEFAGRRGVALLLLLSVAIPISALIIPMFFVVRYLGLLNTYWALILPPLANPLGIFMARSFIVGIPDDLEASARLDGASEFTIYRKIVLPLIRPGLVVLGMFTFMLQYTSFIWPLIAVQDSDRQVLAVGISGLQSAFLQDWGLLSAGMLAAAIPITVVFLLVQRAFVFNDLSGALKE